MKTNRMKKLIAFSLGTLLTFTTASARIGETLEMCKQRYGEPTVHGEFYNFRKPPFVVTVSFYEGKADSESYGKADASGVSETEFEQLLKLNGGDRKWKRLDVVSLCQSTWQTEDGQMVAFYGFCNTNPNNKLVIIGTTASLERGGAEEEAKAKKALEGF
jgi:hypothetical protein